MMSRFKKYFFSGLAVFLPIVLTVYVCIWLLNFMEGLIGRYLKPFFLESYDFYFWGLGILALFSIILFCGFIITHYLGRMIHRFTEGLMLRIPLMSQLYPAFKEIAGFLFSGDSSRKKLGQVVLLEWPRHGIYTLGFLTNDTPAFLAEKIGKDMVNVLIPKVPNPVTGYFMIFPKDQVILLDMTVEEAVKIIVSGGVLDPRAIKVDEDKFQA